MVRRLWPAAWQLAITPLLFTLLQELYPSRNNRGTRQLRIRVLRAYGSDAPCADSALVTSFQHYEPALVTTALPAGRVGIFVGGDGNEVVLEHFKAEWGVANRASVLQSPVSAPASPEMPTPAPTRVPVDGLLAQLDTAWSKQDWSEVLGLLDRIEFIAPTPTAVDFTAKRYAAHVSAGNELLAKGDRTAAVDEFTKAERVDPRA